MRLRFPYFRNASAGPPPVDVASTEPAGEAASREPRYPRLVVGLGNPGAEYGNTRHNVGARCVALLARRHAVTLERHGRIDRAAVRLGGHTLHIARPRAFVNDSGPPVAAELRRLGLEPEDLLVVYDELDLPVARVRIRRRGGHGGNNGMKSIIDAVHSQAFARIRIGIDRPYDDGEPVREPARIADWVLSEPSDEERRRLNAAVAEAADAVEVAAMEGLDAAMSRFNRR